MGVQATDEYARSLCCIVTIGVTRLFGKREAAEPVEQILSGCCQHAVLGKVNVCVDKARQDEAVTMIIHRPVVVDFGQVGHGADPALQRRAARAARQMPTSKTVTFKACTEAFFATELGTGRDAADVVTAVRTAGGPAIDKRSVVISKPIRTVGTHTVGVKLHDAVTAHIGVEVVAA